jgi:hypothetical protein
MASANNAHCAANLIAQRASVSGGYKPFTVRAAGGKVGLCTSTYNHSQDDETKAEIARRVAALWNISTGVPTEHLESLDASGFKFTVKLK